MKNSVICFDVGFYLDQITIFYNADNKPHHQHVEAMGHGKFLASLSKEKAELFHTSMKQAHEKNESLHAQVKSLYAELSVITKAASFDEKAYISKSAEISNLQTTMHKRRREELIA